jgi:hypothetical protein
VAVTSGIGFLDGPLPASAQVAREAREFNNDQQISSGDIA